MAGIGFELKKIFKEESMSSMVKGAGYSTLITIGPTFIIMAVIMLLYIVLGFFKTSYSERELLSSTILYAFIFSVIVTSPFNVVASRYIADKIYLDKYEDILPSYYTGLFMCMLLGSILGIPFLAHVWLVGKVPLLFVWFSYGLFISLIIMFYTSTYLSATKDYKIIALFYTIGMLFTVLLAFLFYYFLKLKTSEAILYALTMGFFLISLLLYFYLRKYFNESSDCYMELFLYCKKHILIILANLFYTLGLYVHNFVFWTKEGRLVIAKTYVSFNAYDMATCLAMFSNITMLVMFTVMTETKFHDIYQSYIESVIGSTYKKISLDKRRMFRLLIQQISHLIVRQLIITAIVFLIVIIFLPKLGFSGLSLDIYPLLAIAYLAIFSMYCNIVFLFYFSDNTGPLLTSFTFFAVSFLASLVSKELPPEWYGLGILIGAIIGWTVSYFRIRYIERNFEAHIFCGKKIVNKNEGERPDCVIYKREKEQEL